MASYLSEKAKVSESFNGKGLFAIKKIAKDELIVDYTKGAGKYINDEESDILYKSGRDHMIQIDDDLFFAATDQNEFEEADAVNHSCEPNSGIQGQLKIVAMREIRPGEEITFDYAMSESSDYEMVCRCNTASCRHLITGQDWQIKNLQTKYKGYFSDYIKEKIDAQNT